MTHVCRKGEIVAQKLTAQTLLDNGITPKTPKEHLRSELLTLIHAMTEKGVRRESIFQSLYPNTILDFETLEALTTALIAGNNILLFGPPGSGKTNLAKDVWGLFPKQVYTVEGCPVGDDPFSVIDEDFMRRAPLCPSCRSRFAEGGSEETFDPEKVDPGKVPVTARTMREGYGFARVQGSPEVFPDNLTGTINIHKLEEIGDPTSPLVMEPGKLLQANRGLLIVDEVGKLPKGTQNVLLQSLQEDIVTPARSRATFPASFIAITTSNMDDLDNINEPLNDRLSNIYVGFNSMHSKNRMIVDLAETDSDMFFPEIFLEADVHLIESWRQVHTHGHELSEVSSNRTMMDIVNRAEAFARVDFHRHVDLASFRKGTLQALLGRIRARSGDSYMRSNVTIEDFVNKHLDESLEKAGKAYWCRFFTGELKKDKAEGQRVLTEIENVLEKMRRDKKNISGDEGNTMIRDMMRSPDHKKFRRFTDHILASEDRKGDLESHEIVERVLFILDEVGTFREKDLLEVL